ncbi:MAG: hypothetical protein KDC45_15680, partial [Bacteroidetes bacterium]|nr:hypothetical protein [Bacteroidota bacterium]
IYFEADTTIKVVNKFYECLKEKGYLAVGHAEPSSLIYDRYLSEIYPDAVMYRKDSAAKKEQQYKTGIRIRRDIFKEYKVQAASGPVHHPMVPKLSMLQKQIDRLKVEPKKPTVVKKKEALAPVPDVQPRAAGEGAPSEDRRSEMTESQLFAAGIELFQQKDFNGAEKNFHEVVALNSRNGRALYMIAHIKANLDQIAEAKAYCFKAIDSDSLLLEAYYLLGLIFKEENAYDESIKMLKKVIYIDQNFAMGYYELAVNYFKMNDNVQGNKYLRQTDKLLAERLPDDRVGILDDMTVAELGMMIKMWSN